MSLDNLPNIAAWCDQFKARTDTRVFPQAAPPLPIIEDLLGDVKKLIEMNQVFHNCILVLDNNQKQLAEELAQLKGASNV